MRLQDYGWDTFHATMVQRLATKTPTDVLYNNGSWLAEFASAGWVAPIRSTSILRSTAARLFLTRFGMTYKGEPYGLPYYADIASFIWNPTVAKTYGSTARRPLGRSDGDVALYAEKGLGQPDPGEFSQTDPSGLDEFIAMSMSRGGEVFDAD